MTIRNLALSLILPLVLWLLLGAPSLRLVGNLAICTVLLLHLFAVIWSHEVFYVLRGDAYTYGNVNRAINLLSLTWTFAITWIALHLADKAIHNIRDISPYAWGAIFLGLLATVTIPVLTSNVSRLPTKADHRVFAKPDIKQS